VSSDFAQAFRKNALQPILVNSSKAVVYRSPIGNEQVDVPISMGQLFFSTSEEHGRICLTTKQFREAPIILGWVNSEHTMRNSIALTISDMVNRELVDPRYINRLNRELGNVHSVPMRVLVRPEIHLSIASAPGEDARLLSVPFCFFYVYDVRSVGGQQFYLLGREQRLFDEPILFDTDSRTGQSRLIGWVLSQDVVPWYSNLVLEYNCQVDAIQERNVRNSNPMLAGGLSKPAVVYDAPNGNSRIVAYEPLEDFWGHHLGVEKNQKLLPLASPGDVGIEPQVARFHLLDRSSHLDSEDAYQIATVGSPTRNIGLSTIDILLQRFYQTSESVCTVDIALMIACDGGIKDNVEVYRSWLKEIVSEWEERVGNFAQKMPAMQLGELKLQPSLTTDIRVSLVGYQRRGGPWIVSDKGPGKVGFGVWSFARAERLDGLKKRIDPFMDLMTRFASDKADSVGEALYFTLTDKQIWRPESRCRVIILLAGSNDTKPGAGRIDLGKAAVEWLQPLTDKATEIEDDFGQGMVTHVFCCYTGDNSYAVFKDEISDLFLRLSDAKSRALPQFFQFANFRENRSTRNNMSEILTEPFEKLEQIIKYRFHRIFGSLDASSPDYIEDLWKNRLSPYPAVSIYSPKLEAGGIEGQKAQASEVAANAGRSEKVILGWVQVRQPEHSQTTYLARVLVNRREVTELCDVMDLFANGVEQTIGVYTGGIRSRSTQFSLIVEALVNGVLSSQGIPLGGESTKHYDSLARRILELAEATPREQFSKVLMLNSSVPLSRDGLFGKAMEDILKMTPEELLREVQVIRMKVQCLKNVKEGRTAPESLSSLEDYKAIQKNWVYRHPISRVEYVYLPINYLP
jgi:hypothetical protein